MIRNIQKGKISEAKLIYGAFVNYHAEEDGVLDEKYRGINFLNIDDTHIIYLSDHELTVNVDRNKIIIDSRWFEILTPDVSLLKKFCAEHAYEVISCGWCLIYIG